jgi:hypothetical protein
VFLAIPNLTVSTTVTVVADVTSLEVSLKRIF